MPVVVLVACGRIDYGALDADGGAGDAGRPADGSGSDATTGGDDAGDRDAGTDDAGTADAGGPVPCTPWPPGFRFEVTGPVTEVNGPAADVEPSLSADGLTLYFSSTREGVDKSIFASRRPRLDEQFGTPELLAWTSSVDKDGPLWLRSDGLEAILSSERGAGAGGSDIWRATRASVDDPFGSLENLSVVNTAVNEWDGFITADGLELWLARGQLSSPRNTTIQRSVRPDGDGAFGAPEVVAELDGPDSSGNATLTSDRRVVVFYSDRPGVGGRDIWYAIRAAAEEPFGAPELLPGVNTVDWDWEPHLRRDGCELFFVRGELEDETDIYRAVYVGP